MSHQHFDGRQPARIVPFPVPANGSARKGEGMSATMLRTPTGATDSAPHSTWTTIAGGRSTRRPALSTKDLSAMNSTSFGISHIVASARHADFLAEAERERAIASIRTNRARGAAESIRSIRMRIGAALIRVGERLHGADDRCADLGSFRAARS